MSSVKKAFLAGISAAILLASVTVDNAAAQDRNRLFGYHGFGPRVGLSIEPDQVFFGAHVDFGEAFPKVRFQPNIEFGFGDNITLIQADADFHYRFLESWDVWNPYLGGGVGMAHWSFDSEVEGFDASTTKVQIHAVGGIEKYISSGKFFVESKIGIVDESPDLKFLAGWTFFR